MLCLRSARPRRLSPRRARRRSPTGARACRCPRPRSGRAPRRSRAAAAAARRGRGRAWRCVGSASRGPVRGFGRGRVAADLGARAQPAHCGRVGAVRGYGRGERGLGLGEERLGRRVVRRRRRVRAELARALPERLPEVAVRERVRRVGAHGGAQRALGLVELAELEQHLAERRVVVGARRRRARRGAERVGRLAEPALPRELAAAATRRPSARASTARRAARASMRKSSGRSGSLVEWGRILGLSARPIWLDLSRDPASCGHGLEAGRGRRPARAERTGEVAGADLENQSGTGTLARPVRAPLALRLCGL